MKLSEYAEMLKFVVGGLSEGEFSLDDLEEDIKRAEMVLDDVGDKEVDFRTRLAKITMKPKPKQEVKKPNDSNEFPPRLEAYRQEVLDILFFPKKLLEELADYREYTKDYRKAWLTKLTKAKKQQADADGISREEFEKQLEKDWKEWSATNK
jgi:hypothetical protein